MSAVVGGKPVDVGGLDDDTLVRLARTGHEEAFDQIVLRYRAPLASYCRRWLDPHRAEEVVQHTFMKAFLCLRDDDRTLVLRPWLYRVVHNAALNALEKKGSDWDQLDENYDGVPQPPQVAEQRARFRGVIEEIEMLPPRQRDALLLNEFEGRCYADIAAELGTSEAGVRGLLRRARSQLRRAAAVLVPFPALRELVRLDPGRSMEVDRTGEIIGSAGAAGGLGAAGLGAAGGGGAAGGAGAAGAGFAKLAAGVLAAGTLAGGGSAIERGHHPWEHHGGKNAAPASQAAHAPRPAPPIVVAAVGLRTSPAAQVRRHDAPSHAQIAPRSPRKQPRTKVAPAPDRKSAPSPTPEGAEAPAAVPPLGTIVPGTAPEQSEETETAQTEPQPQLASGGSGTSGGECPPKSSPGTSDPAPAPTPPLTQQRS